MFSGKRDILKIIVIGCGPHFQARYFPVLNDLNRSGFVSISLVVDLESQRASVEKFFTDHGFSKITFLFLPEWCRDSLTLDSLRYFMGTTVNLREITHAIISTEPKSHKAYALWAIENNIHAFIDKPLTAFTSHRGWNTLYNDYLEIISKLKDKNLNFVLSCERRYNLGYRFIEDYLKDFIKTYRFPITYVDIHFGGGNWVMPNEFFDRENHPFKYGYGILLHSGYHYVDLLFRLMALNKALLDFSIDDITLKAVATYPQNQLHSFSKDFYQNVFDTNSLNTYFSSETLKHLKYFGETDVTIIGQLRKSPYVFTTFSLKILGTTLSQRVSSDAPHNPYLSGGRLRQENLIIHVGHLCSIYLKSHPYSKIQQETDSLEDFSISIMHNSHFIKKSPFMRIEREDLSKIYSDLSPHEKLNSKARQEQLASFLEGKDANSSLFSHRDSLNLLSKIYQTINADWENHGKF